MPSATGSPPTSTGPAGAVAALMLARAGVRVLVLERDPLPRLEGYLRAAGLLA